MEGFPSFRCTSLYRSQSRHWRFIVACGWLPVYKFKEKSRSAYQHWVWIIIHSFVSILHGRNEFKFLIARCGRRWTFDPWSSSQLYLLVIPLSSSQKTASCCTRLLFLLTCLVPVFTSQSNTTLRNTLIDYISPMSYGHIVTLTALRAVSLPSSTHTSCNPLK